MSSEAVATRTPSLPDPKLGRALREAGWILLLGVAAWLALVLFTYHRADPGPIDHEQTRKFISRPSPAPLDLGLSGHSSDDHDDYGSSSDDNGGWGWSD